MSCSSAASRSTRSGPGTGRPGRSPARSPAPARSASARRRPCAGGARRSPAAAPAARAARGRPARCRPAAPGPRRGSAARAAACSSSSRTRSADTIVDPARPSSRIAATTARRDREAELGGEPGRAHHPQRVVAERLLRRRPACAAPRPPGRRSPPYGSTNVSVAAADGHRVDGEVAPRQVALEACRRTRPPACATSGSYASERYVVTSTHDVARARAPIVPNSRPIVPVRVAPGAAAPSVCVRPGVGGEVQVRDRPPEQRVAHRAADQGQLVPGGGEPSAQVVEHVGIEPDHARAAPARAAERAGDRVGSAEAVLGDGGTGVKRARWRPRSGSDRRRRPHRLVTVTACPVRLDGPAAPGAGRMPHGGGDLRGRPGRRLDAAAARSAAVIARLNRAGRLEWCLPKGHLEDDETPEQAAVREIEEETGHPRRRRARAWARSTTGSRSRAGGCTSSCTTTCCGPPAAG